MFGRAIACSLGVHAALLLALALLWRAIASLSPASLPIAFVAPSVTSVTGDHARAEPRDDPPTAIELRAPGDAWRDVAAPGAPTPAMNPDVAAGAAARSSGHGAGAPTVVTARADQATLRVQPYDAATGYAMQRIRTGKERESREEVRATPHPAPTPWLSSRAGDGHARTPPATNEPAARVERVEPGAARPDVQENPAATDAAKPSEEVADRVDEALVSDEKQPQKIELSRPTSPGAETRGRGDGALGFSPTAQGKAPVPAGAPGLPDARALELATYERAYDRYLAGVRQKVDPLWEFPRELAVRMEQGDVLVAFTIRRDGSVTDVRVLKGSGFAKFDKNVLSAIKKAAPFGPLPPALGGELRVTAPFEGSNPAIR
ncbi:MAG TPA: TonB family protein [Polyangia bacterium]